MRAHQFVKCFSVSSANYLYNLGLIGRCLRLYHSHLQPEIRWRISAISLDNGIRRSSKGYRIAVQTQSALTSMSPRYSGGACAGLSIGVPVSLQLLAYAFFDIGNQFTSCGYVEPVAPSCANDRTPDRVEFWPAAGRYILLHGASHGVRQGLESGQDLFSGDSCAFGPGNTAGLPNCGFQSCTPSVVGIYLPH